MNGFLSLWTPEMCTQVISDDELAGCQYDIKLRAPDQCFREAEVEIQLCLLQKLIGTSLNPVSPLLDTNRMTSGSEKGGRPRTKGAPGTSEPTLGRRAGWGVMKTSRNRASLAEGTASEKALKCT